MAEWAAHHLALKRRLLAKLASYNFTYIHLVNSTETPKARYMHLSPNSKLKVQPMLHFITYRLEIMFQRAFKKWP